MANALCAGKTASERHTWKPVAGVGWFVCAWCGVAGVCLGCVKAAGAGMPEHVPFWLYCPTHGDKHMQRYDVRDIASHNAPEVVQPSLF